MIENHLSASAQQNIEALIDERVDVSCDLISLDEHNWAIRGWIAVDGEVIVAKFDNQADAEEALEELEAAGRTPPRAGSVQLGEEG